MAKLAHKVLHRSTHTIVRLICSFLPIKKNKIMIVSYYGRGYSDNPKYIGEAVYSQHINVKIFWAIASKKYATTLPKFITPIKYESALFYYHLYTAGIWIDNCRKWSYIKKRPGQYYIQTYHALPLKKVEADVTSSLDKGYVASAQNDSLMTDIMISNSHFMSDLYKNSFWYDGKVMECGFPRNDILVCYPTDKISSIRQKVGLRDGEKCVLYAPTFRKSTSLNAYNLSYRELQNVFESRFGGKWRVAIRLHPNIAKKSKELGLENDILDVTYYDDMQELLLAADSLIVDYSSSILDYILLERPCFMYAPDYDEYMADRGIYFGVDRLPFAVAYNKQELYDAIHQYDARDAKKKIELFKKTNGYRENGDAAYKIASDVIMRQLL